MIQEALSLPPKGRQGACCQLCSKPCLHSISIQDLMMKNTGGYISWATEYGKLLTYARDTVILVKHLNEKNLTEN